MGIRKENWTISGKGFYVYNITAFNSTVNKQTHIHFQFTNHKPFFPTRKEKGCVLDSFVNLTQAKII